MSAGAWFLLACAIASLIACVAGVVAVLRTAALVKRRAQTIVPGELVAKATAAQRAVERLNGDLVLAETLLPRAMVALDRIAASLGVLRRVFSPGR